MLVSAPLNVDSERLFPLDPGAAGCSIEDYDPKSATIDPIDVATDAVATAATACRRHGLVLTARAENHLYDAGDLDDTIARLIAFRDAGAEVLYAPGVGPAADIERLCAAVEAPMNFLAATSEPSIPELARMGVRRISAGSALYNAAHRTLRRDAEAMRLRT